MTYEYRDDQLAALDAIDLARQSGAKSALVSKATGLGKTLIGCEYISRWIDEFGKKSRILVLGHTGLIFTEFRKHLDNMLGFNGYTWGEYSGNMQDLDKVQVLFGMFQTLTKEEHLELFDPSEFDLIVVDECHHAMAETYKRVLDYFKPKFTLALTATPDRMDRKEIREIFGEEVYSLTLPEAMSKGGLLAKVEYKIFIDNLKGLDEIKTEAGKLKLKALNKKFFIPQRDEDIAAQIVNELSGTENPRVVVFCPSIHYAKHMASVICGEIPETTALVSSLSQNERGLRLKRFRSGQLKVLCAVDMLNEVLDVPEVTHVVFLRSTQSYTILLQQLGRGLRLPPNSPNKVLKVLDFVCSFERIKMISEMKDQIATVSRDRDPFEVIVNHGSFKRLSKDVSQILKVANPFWKVDDVVKLIQVAINMNAEFGIRIYKSSWERFKRQNPQLKLPEFAVLKRFQEYLPTNILKIDTYIGFEQARIAFGRALRIQPSFRDGVFESQWRKFCKEHPEEKFPNFDIIKRYSKQLGVKIIRKSLGNNANLEDVKILFSAACERRPDFRKALCEFSWESFKKSNPDLILPAFSVLKRLRKELGINIERRRSRVTLGEVKMAVDRFCNHTKSTSKIIFQHEWAKVRLANPELKLPDITVLKKFITSLGIEIRRVTDVDSNLLLKYYNQFLVIYPECREVFSVAKWNKFKTFQQDHSIPSAEILIRKLGEMNIRIVIRQKLSSYTFEDVKPLFEIASSFKPNFKSTVYHFEWEKFRMERSDLKLPTFPIIEKYADLLGIKVTRKERKLDNQRVLDAVFKATKADPKLRTGMYRTGWMKLKQLSPELNLPCYAVIARCREFLETQGIVFK